MNRSLVDAAREFTDALKDLKSPNLDCARRILAEEPVSVVYLSEGNLLRSYVVLLNQDPKLANSLYEDIATHYEQSRRRKDILENLDLARQTYNQLVMSCSK